MVIADLEAGGAQRVVATLANAWAERGRRVALITLDTGGPSFFPLHRALERLPLGLQGESRGLLSALGANLRRVLALRRAIKGCGAPLVVSFVGATNVLAVLATRGLGVRLVVCERNDPARQSLGRPWDWLRRTLYRRADAVTANSRDVIEGLRATVPPEKLHYLPNPLVTGAPGPAAEARTRTILSVGRLVRQKGTDVLLEAFARSRARAEGWRLAILGEGELGAALRRQAEDLGLGGQVDWLGRQAEPAGHYAGAALFVLASRHEGMPNAVLEAMALGCPVIVTTGSGGALDLVADGESGLVVPSEDADALAAALDRLAGDPALRQRLAAAARLGVEPFGLERVLPLWQAVLAPEEGRAKALAGDQWAETER